MHAWHVHVQGPMPCQPCVALHATHQQESTHPGDQQVMVQVQRAQGVVLLEVGAWGVAWAVQVEVC